MNDITVNDLSFRYADSDQLILQDVNMRVREGDFVCLLGQSGCGKSTFLRLMAGLEAPSSGSICVDGRPIDGTSLERSVVFQDYGLFPWMSAGENIVLALRQRFPEKSKAECRDIARRALREVGLKDEVFGQVSQIAVGRHEAALRHRSQFLHEPADPADGRAVRRARRRDAGAPAGHGVATCGRTRSARRRCSSSRTMWRRRCFWPPASWCSASRRAR